MIVVESLSCKLEWGLAQVFAISIPLTIVAMESEVYECQTKYAKAIFVVFLNHFINELFYLMKYLHLYSHPQVYIHGQA